MPEEEAGSPVAEPGRKRSVRGASVFKWKTKSGGMEGAAEANDPVDPLPPNEAKNPSAAEDETPKLKR